MAMVNDLGHYLPVYRDGQTPRESQYWKRIGYTATLDDNYIVLGGCQLDDGGTAATEDSGAICVAPCDLWVKAVYAVFTDGSVTGQDTNYKSINIINEGSDGSGSTEIASIDFTNGIDATQNAPTALTLSGTAANLLIDEGEVVTAQYAKTGDGVALNEANIFMVCEPMIDTANLVSDEQVLMVAPHRMQVLAAYAVFKEGDITGADTNYPEIDIINKGTDGSDTTEIAEEAFTSGVDATQHDDVALTLSSTASDLIIDRGEVVVARLVKAGSGMHVQEVDVHLIAKAIE